MQLALARGLAETTAGRGVTIHILKGAPSCSVSGFGSRVQNTGRSQIAGSGLAIIHSALILLKSATIGFLYGAGSSLTSFSLSLGMTEVDLRRRL